MTRNKEGYRFQRKKIYLIKPIEVDKTLVQQKIDQTLGPPLHIWTPPSLKLHLAI